MWLLLELILGYVLSVLLYAQHLSWLAALFMIAFAYIIGISMGTLKPSPFGTVRGLSWALLALAVFLLYISLYELYFLVDGRDAAKLAFTQVLSMSAGRLLSEFVIIKKVPEDKGKDGPRRIE